jgi:hypothetical protein
MLKKKSTIFLLILILLAGSFLVAEAKKKTKWQLRLERNQIPLTFWKKYRPKVTRNEYKKAMKKYTNYQQSNQIVPNSQDSSQKYPLHRNITTTTFWIGEESGPDNHYIPNTMSAWDSKWTEHFGGVDDPNNRNGYLPAAFTPNENPFYFGVPYNDFDENGNRKQDVQTVIPWASERIWSADESICKNRWVKIVKGDKTAYAQWEDVGPFGEDDTGYVFGSTAVPRSEINNHAGLDVSPAVRDYLGLSGMDACDWQFVDANDVPDGPWKQILTTSNVYWD